MGKRLVIRNRNHLSAMVNSTISSNGQVMDFTLTSVGLYGTNAMRVNGSVRALWAGDVSRNGTVSYTGSSNDRARCWWRWAARCRRPR